MNQPNITFADPAVQQCPFHAYATLQEEAPVYFDEVAKVYVVTRYEDVKEIMLDPARFSNNTGLVQTDMKPELVALYEKNGWVPVPTLISNDPPDHRYFRSFIDGAFSAKRVASLEDYITRRSNELIDKFLDERGEIDMVKAFTLPLPLRLIMDLIGVPADMYDQMCVWAEAGPESTSPVLTPERERELAEIVIEMQHYFAGLIEQFRKQPADNLLSDISNNEVDGKMLSMAELLSMIAILLAAGYDTTASSLASAVAGLCERPELQEELRGNSEKLLTYADEILRLYGPLQGLFRRATQDTEIAGVKIPKGAILNPRWGAGNRDPRIFPNPDQLDMNRHNPGKSMAFGLGIHICAGRPLARAELRIALDQLLNRTRNLRFARGDREHSWIQTPHFVTWGPRHLYVKLDKR